MWSYAEKSSNYVTEYWTTNMFFLDFFCGYIDYLLTEFCVCELPSLSSWTDSGMHSDFNFKNMYVIIYIFILCNC